jgi:N-methylhydantoinase A
MRIGIDIGGTFTDFVRYDPEQGTIETSKRLSTPDDPAAAVLAGLRDDVGPREIVHGALRSPGRAAATAGAAGLALRGRRAC